MYNTIKDDIIKVGLIEGTQHIVYPRFGNNKPYVTRDPRFQNVIYTDGDAKVVEEFTINDINHIPLDVKLDELNLIKNVYYLNRSIDELVFKRVVIENASYFINLNLEYNWIEFARVHGFFWQLKDLQVNVKRPISKEIRKKIKQTLNFINGEKLSYNASIFEAILGKNVTPRVEYEESLDKVYKLKKN